MRLLTFTVGGETRLGARVENRVIDLNRAYRALLHYRGHPRAQELAAALVPPTMESFLAGEDDALQAAKEAMDFTLSNPMTQVRAGANIRDGIVHELDEVRLRAPLLHPPKIVCLGLNYMDHYQEALEKFPDMPLPGRPVVFGKFNSSIIGPDDPIVVPSVTNEVDYEAELAFVIGRRGRHVPVEKAMEYVAGYTLLNDISARDYQHISTQWTIGKTFDSFTPLGPELVLKDEVPDPHSLELRLSISGVPYQVGNTSDQIFKIPEVVAFLSDVFTLEPGDLISTGTPAGIGSARTPPRYLVPGDVVEIEASVIGILRNPVIKEVEGDEGSRLMS